MKTKIPSFTDVEENKKQESISRKWFYKFAHEIEKRIEDNNYSRHGYCLYQEITKDRYFECWDLQDNETGKVTQILFVVNKITGFLFSYNSNTGL